MAKAIWGAFLPGLLYIAIQIILLLETKLFPICSIESINCCQIKHNMALWHNTLRSSVCFCVACGEMLDRKFVKLTFYSFFT